MVRNMGLLTLLIIGALFAAFYLPSNITAGRDLVKQNPVDVSYRIPASAQHISEQEVMNLAEDYGQEIQDYKEIEFVELLGSGVNRDDVDDSGKLIEKYKKEAYSRQFVSVSEINSKMGCQLSVEEGKYKMIVSENMTESLFYKFDDMDYVQNMATGINRELKFSGTVIFNELTIDNGWDSFGRFIISDKDYDELRKDADKKYVIKQVLFNVKDVDASYEFSKELYKEYCLKADADMKVHLYYDSYLEQKAIENDEAYTEAQRIELQPEHPEIDLEWKFAPYFKILFRENMILQFAVQYLLFAYVAIVMLTSVGIIGFTRSQSIGIRNKQVFEDVRKLGGDNTFILRCMKSQLKKVYFLPTSLGIGIIYLYQIMIFFQNDGGFKTTEIKAALIDLGLCVLVAGFQYIGYRISLKEVKKIVNI